MSHNTKPASDWKQQLRLVAQEQIRRSEAARQQRELQDCLAKLSKGKKPNEPTQSV
jgi:hypothetical protein